MDAILSINQQLLLARLVIGDILVDAGRAGKQFELFGINRKLTRNALQVRRTGPDFAILECYHRAGSNGPVDRHCDLFLLLINCKIFLKINLKPDKATDESKSNEILPSGLG